MTKEGVDLIATGYKYSSSKVIFFIMTDGAGSTKSGTSYFSKFQDGEGNVVMRAVDRPVFASRFYGYSPAVDNNNQARQAELGLEEIWKTQDCWFRLFTTIVGMTTTDTYFGIRETVHTSHPFHDMSMLHFTDRLAYQLVNNKQEDGRGSSGGAAPPVAGGRRRRRRPARRLAHRLWRLQPLLPLRQRRPTLTRWTSCLARRRAGRPGLGGRHSRTSSRA